MDLPLGHYVNGHRWEKTLDFTFGIPFYITMYSRYIKRTKLLAIILYVYDVYLCNANLDLSPSGLHVNDGECKKIDGL
jgi:hypothetical protein